MSKDHSLTEWDKVWFDYNKSLKIWMGVFESLQRAAKDVQSKYASVMAEALKNSNEKTLDQFTENWQKSISDAGISTSKQFNDEWLKVFNQSAMEQVKTYGEMMHKFAETWQRMWNKR